MLGQSGKEAIASGLANPHWFRPKVDPKEIRELSIKQDLRPTIDALLFPFYMMLFSINSVLQALKQPVWTLWISLYRQGLGVGLFVWIFIYHFQLGVVGVWFGIAAAVFTGWLLALFIVAKVTKNAIGGLR